MKIVSRNPRRFRALTDDWDVNHLGAEIVLNLSINQIRTLWKGLLQLRTRAHLAPIVIDIRDGVIESGSSGNTKLILERGREQREDRGIV
jgi:hypothetical protein